MTSDARENELKATIREVAKLAKIPDVGRIGFENVMKKAVMDAQTLVKLKHPPKSEALKHLQVYRDAIQTLIELSETRFIDESSDKWAARAFAQTHLKTALSRLKGMHADEDEWNWNLALMEMNKVVEKAIAQLESRNFKGPLNSQKQTTDNFIRTLMNAVQIAHGKLTSSRKGGDDSGGLPKALRMFEPYLAM